MSLASLRLHSPWRKLHLFHLSRRSRGEGGTIHVATARVLLRDISKILFPDNPVNVPVIK